MDDITVERSGNNTTDRLAFKVLNSNTLVKTLIDALNNDWSNHALEVILRELSRKGYEQQRLLQMVEDQCGKPAALKVIRIIFSH